MASRAKRALRKQHRHFTRSRAEDLNFRAFKLRAKTANNDTRTVDASITTETPVNEWDWSRGEMVPRVLLTEGAQLPKSRQVPLLDAHNRYSVASQLGSVRNIAKDPDGGTKGTLEFSTASGDAWTKVREGHVTDVSAGFEVLNETYLAAGESRSWYGKEFTGPINVATKWRLHEASVVPIGADEQAKLRGYRIAGGKLVKEQQTDTPPAGGITPKETLKVKPELRKRCIECGMDASLTDEQALEWMAANVRLLNPQPTVVTAQPDKTAESIERLAADLKAIRDEQLAQRAAADQRAAFERDVNATLTLVFDDQIPADVQRDALACKNIEEARAKIQAGKKAIADATPIGGAFTRTELTASQRDKHREVLQTALLVRAYDLRGYGMADKLLPQEKRTKGWEQFQNTRLLDIARECLLADGFTYNELRGLSSASLAISAMGWPHKAGLRAMGYAYHVTGSLAHITLDAINKNLTAGYQEFPATWRGPMRQAASVPDFKQKHIIKMGAVGNLPIWQDNSIPHEGALSNEKESYGVEARAETLSFSWQLLVNDDMDALSRGPALLGNAAARTVNAVAWAQVTGNPTMNDAQTLFLETATGNRKRSNLTTGSATPTVATLQTMTNKMMQMRGLNTPEGNESQDILNLQPVYLPHPGALRTTVMQLVNSIADPASNNAGVYNPSRGLIPVTEPLLDASSTTAWYLFASPTQVDTIEVTFLAGQESPVINDYVDEATMSRKVTIIQSFAAKAADHRGVQKHDGA